MAGRKALWSRRNANAWWCRQQRNPARPAPLRRRAVPRIWAIPPSARLVSLTPRWSAVSPLCGPQRRVKSKTPPAAPKMNACATKSAPANAKSLMRKSVRNANALLPPVQRPKKKNGSRPKPLLQLLPLPPRASRTFCPLNGANLLRLHPNHRQLRLRVRPVRGVAMPPLPPRRPAFLPPHRPHPAPPAPEPSAAPAARPARAGGSNAAAPAAPAAGADPARAPVGAKPGLATRKTDRERDDRATDRDRAKKQGEDARRTGKLTLNDALAGEGGRTRSLAAMKR